MWRLGSGGGDFARRRILFPSSFKNEQMVQTQLEGNVAQKPEIFPGENRGCLAGVEPMVFFQ